MFKKKSLDIVITWNMKNSQLPSPYAKLKRLNDGSYSPYKKPDEETNYIHVNFKTNFFKKSILKQLPMSIEKRLSSLWSPKDICKETTPYYEKYLSNCGYTENLNYRDSNLQI